MLPEFMTSVSYAIVFTITAGVVIGLRNWRSLSAPLRYLHKYLIFALLSEIAFRNFGGYTGYNLFMIPIYAVLELIILSYFFYHHVLQRNKIILLGTLVGLILILADTFFLSELFVREKFQTLSIVIKDLVLMGCCLKYYHSWLQGEVEDRDWFATAGVMLFFFTINTILFASINFLVNETQSIIIWFWLMNNVVMVCYYSFLTYKLW